MNKWTALVVCAVAAAAAVIFAIWALAVREPVNKAQRCLDRGGKVVAITPVFCEKDGETIDVWRP